MEIGKIEFEERGAWLVSNGANDPIVSGIVARIEAAERALVALERTLSVLEGAVDIQPNPGYSPRYDDIL